jgi:hypothetical protein
MLNFSNYTLQYTLHDDFGKTNFNFDVNALLQKTSKINLKHGFLLIIVSIIRKILSFKKCRFQKIQKKSDITFFTMLFNRIIY